MKKWILMILVSGLAFFSTRQSDMNILNSCFEKSGARLVSESLCAWTEISTPESPESIACVIYEAMGFHDLPSQEYVNDMYLLTGNDGKNEIVIKTKCLDSKGNIYACIEFSQHDAMMNINNMRRKIKDIFRIYDSEISFSVVIQGKYNKKLCLEEMKEKARLLLEASSASYVDGIADGSMVSYCAFSESIPAEEARVVNGNKININIALRASETYDCTYIWIGYPIITIEY